jgi:cell shape-determining protein MreD
MAFRISQRILYRIGAVAFIPIASYNLVVWFGNPDTRWEQQYLKSLIGGISCLVLSLVFLVLSFVRQDRQIVLCDRQS